MSPPLRNGDEDGDRMTFLRVVCIVLGASLLPAQTIQAPWRRVFPRESAEGSVRLWRATPPLWTRGRQPMWPVTPTTFPGAVSTTGNAYVTPSQMRNAYGVSLLYYISTIAIVDAYDSPSVEADLQVFSATYGLPGCTSDNGCFTKVNQNGLKIYPRRDVLWESEINLDVQWAHAMAPNAKILLVEAHSDSDADLFAAVNYAQQKATIVSMSWSGPEWEGQQFYEATVFNRSHVTFLAASGDQPGVVRYPASSANVIGVGGTSFATNSLGFVILPVTESGWSDQYGGTGGGCSVYTPQPSYQATWAPSTCKMRGVPDISLDADPASGVMVYISRQGGWVVYGGTSLACPMLAGLLANVNGYRAVTAGKSASAPLGDALLSIYTAATRNYTLYFNDVKTGGRPFAAGPRWDFSTGLGSPKAGALMQYLVTSTDPPNSFPGDAGSPAVRRFSPVKRALGVDPSPPDSGPPPQ